MWYFATQPVMSEPVMQNQMISVHAGDSLYKTDRSSVKLLSTLKNLGTSSGVISFYFSFYFSL